MAIAKRLDDIESIIRAKKNNSGSTVFGVFRPYIEDDVIHPDKAIHVKSVKLVNGDWVDTDEEYLATISEKALPALTSKKRFIGLIGGRGSGKSEGESQKCVAKMHDNGERLLVSVNSKTQLTTLFTHHLRVTLESGTCPALSVTTATLSMHPVVKLSLGV